MSFLIKALLLLLTSWALWANELPEDEVADLDKVYQVALQNDAVLAAALASKKATETLRPQAWARLLPAIRLSGNYSRTDADAEFKNNQSVDRQTVVGSDSGELGWQLVVSQPLLNFQTWYGLKGVQASLSQAEVRYLTAKSSLTLRTLEAYLNILRNRDLLDSLQAIESSFKRQLEQIEVRRKSGMLSNIDLLEAQASYDTAVANRLQAEGNQLSFFAALRAITNTDFKAIGRFSDDFPITPPDPTGVEQWLEMALQNNLGIKVSKFALEIAQQTLNAQKAKGLPSLDATARYGRTEFTDDARLQMDASDIRQIEISLSVPLFRFGAGSAENRQAKHEREVARYSLLSTRRNTRRDVRSLYQLIFSDVYRVQATKRAMESARLLAESTRIGYEANTRSTLDLLEAESAVHTSEFSYAAAIYDYILTRARLKQQVAALNQHEIGALSRFIDRGNPVELPDLSRPIE